MPRLGLREFRIITICVFLVCVILHTAGFSSAFWFKRRDMYGWLVHHGLWFLCDYYRTGGMDNKCFKLVNRYDNFEDGELRGVQALMCISLICNIVAASLFIPWIACGETRIKPTRSKLLGFIGFVLCIVSGGLTLISITWFGIHYEKYRRVLNWSYILTSISGGILFLGGISGLVILLRCDLTRAPPKEDIPSTRPMPPLPTLTLPPLPSLPPPPAAAAAELVLPRSTTIANTSFDTASTATSIYDGDFGEKSELASIYEDDIFEKSQLAAIYGDDLNEKKQLVDLELNPNYIRNYAYTNSIV